MNTKLGRIYAVLDVYQGDSGKATVLSWFILFYNIIYGLRYQGGAGSGRTLYILINGEMKKIVLHQMLSTIVHGGVGALGPNCVILPEVHEEYKDDGFNTDFSPPRMGLREEVEYLQRMGITVDPDHFVIDPNCVVTVEELLDWEMGQEGQQKTNLFTTRRGVGPSYMALSGRFAITVGGCLDERRLDQEMDRFESLFKPFTNRVETKQKLLAWGRWLKTVATVRHVHHWLAEVQEAGHDIAMESCQGALINSMRDRPFNTSSEIWPPLGLGPLRKVTKVGIFKAMPTKIGEGPFPPEVPVEDAPRLVEALLEYAATTGHGRRIGVPWIPGLREGLFRIGFDRESDILIVTKADLQVGVGPVRGYKSMELDGNEVRWIDSHWDIYDPDVPGSNTNGRLVLTEPFLLPQVQEPVTGITEWDALDPSVQEFFRIYEEALGYPIAAIKTGPNTEDLAIRIPERFPPKG